MELGDKLLKQSIGENVAVYYNDTHRSVSFKRGKLIDFDLNNLFISSGEENILIPRGKCIRIELGVAVGDKTVLKR
jgi:ribosome maturation factor RimP